MSKKKDSLKPWLSRPTINRSVTLPLTRPLTQRLSNLNEFHPNELDPYLLFDARDSMIGTLENPTLDLDPSKPDTLNVITATRAGVATFTDANGLIASASADTVRVDYTQGAELTPTKFQNVVQTDYSASPNGGFNMNLTDIDGPEGASGGVRVSETAVNGQHYLSINRIPVVSGQSYTVSFYIKEGAYSSVRVYTQSSRINTDVNFNFSTGTATFGGSDLIANSGIVSTVGGGWYRVSYSAIASNGGLMSLYVTVKDLSSYAGDVNNFTDYYGFQVEEGTTASSFVANTTGSPKFITGATFGPRVPMILVEPSSENLVTYSEDFSNSLYTKRNSTVTSGFSSPDGLNNAFKLTAAANEGDVYFVLGGGGGTTKAVSVFAKAASATSELIIQELGYTGRSTKFNLNSGAITFSNSAGTSTIQNVGDGWFRCTHIETYSSGQNTLAYAYRSTTVDSLYLFGAQIETGSVATSYIPTSGGNAAARTRAADDLVISGSAFSNFYNASEGTVYAEFLYDHDQTSKYVYSITETGSNEIRSQILASSLRTRYTVNSSHLANLENNGILRGSLNRSAFSYKTNDFRLNLNGGSDDEELSGAASINPIKLTIGSRGASNYFNGRLRRLIFWPYHSDSL